MSHCCGHRPASVQFPQSEPRPSPTGRCPGLLLPRDFSPQQPRSLLKILNCTTATPHPRSYTLHDSPLLYSPLFHPDPQGPLQPPCPLLSPDAPCSPIPGNTSHACTWNPPSTFPPQGLCTCHSFHQAVSHPHPFMAGVLSSLRSPIQKVPSGPSFQSSSLPCHLPHCLPV